MEAQHLTCDYCLAAEKMSQRARYCDKRATTFFVRTGLGRPEVGGPRFRRMCDRHAKEFTTGSKWTQVSEDEARSLMAVAEVMES